MKNLGEILKSQRKKQKLTYNQVYSRIKIHPNYIKALEQNDYSVFDGKIHAKGFLKIYAGLLNLNVSQILALWRREYSNVFEENLDVKVEKSIVNDLKQGFTLTSNKVLAGLGFILLFGFFGYLFYSYKTYSGPPELEISSPQNNEIVRNSLIDITGSTDIDSVLFVNGERILLKQDGSFATSLALKEGVNTLNITSISKLDKKTEKVMTVIYRPQEFEEKVVDESDNEEEDIAESAENASTVN